MTNYSASVAAPRAAARDRILFRVCWTKCLCVLCEQHLWRRRLLARCGDAQGQRLRSLISGV